MHYHHQNLDTRPGDGFNATGHLWKHGRAWLEIWRFKFHWTWCLWAHFCAAEVSCGSEDGVQLNVAVPPVSFWFSVYIDSKWFRDFAYRHDWKEFGVRVHSWAIWVNLWGDDSCHSFEKSKGFWHPEKRRFSWHPVDTLLGRLTHKKEREIENVKITVPMPEAAYKGKCSLQVETWKRKRWPWWPSAKRLVRAHIDMDDPIPFPGKGENSWDCGEDAIHGLICQADTVPKAIAAITESVLYSRQKYGGRNWTPSNSSGG